MSNDIFFAKTKTEAVIPTRERGNAGFDIYACFGEEYLIIKPNETRLIPTGIASALPEDYYFQIQERGSSGSKGIKYSAGVIDANYRGEWFLAATNTNNKPVVILKGNVEKFPNVIKNIFKETMIIYPYEKALFQAVLHNVHNDLIATEIQYTQLKDIKSSRGTGVLGSSGK